jgi:hypothetical protein
VIHHDSGLLYELARELIGGRMSSIASQLQLERSKELPDRSRIEQLKAQTLALYLERESLRSDCEAMVRETIARYARCSAQELDDILGAPTILISTQGTDRSPDLE